MKNPGEDTSGKANQSKAGKTNSRNDKELE
jgi:hypothetical protein